jgi:hypothetical protein
MFQRLVTWRLVWDIRGPRRAGPPQAMTSPVRASTWISRMPMSAAWQGLAAAMLRRTGFSSGNVARFSSGDVARPD